MNIVSIKKMLLEGKAPEKEINLTDKQIRYLAATVPCIKIWNPNATQYYFPGAKTYLQVTFRGNFSYYNTSGLLFKISDNDDRLFLEPGVCSYVRLQSGEPAVFNIQDFMGRILLEQVQKNLWLNKKPYYVRIDGYESIHTRGWPNDERFGHPKSMLSVRDGDYKSYFLTLQTIHQDGNWGDDVGRSLKEAILKGEYTGQCSPDEFSSDIHKRTANIKRNIEREFQFRDFVKNDPVKSINKTIAENNEEIDKINTLLKMATEIRRLMKKNPGWFRKIQTIHQNHGLKSSQLFREMESIKGLKDLRYNLLNDEHITDYSKRKRRWWAIRDAVEHLK